MKEKGRIYLKDFINIFLESEQRNEFLPWNASTICRSLLKPLPVTQPHVLIRHPLTPAKHQALHTIDTLNWKLTYTCIKEQPFGGKYASNPCSCILQHTFTLYPLLWRVQDLNCFKWEPMDIQKKALSTG